MSNGRWTRQTRISKGLPEYTVRELRAMKKKGKTVTVPRGTDGKFVSSTPKPPAPSGQLPPQPTAPTVIVPTPPPPTTPEPPVTVPPPVTAPPAPADVFVYTPTVKTEAPVTRGEEIRFEGQTDPEPAATETTTETNGNPDGSSKMKLEDLFSEDEIEELLGMIWQDGGNFFLKKARRELVEDAEAVKLGHISMLVFKKRFGDKIQAIPELYLICYAALVFGSKDKLEPTPEYKAPDKKKDDKKKPEPEEGEIVEETSGSVTASRREMGLE